MSSWSLNHICVGRLQVAQLRLPQNWTEIWAISHSRKHKLFPFFFSFTFSNGRQDLFNLSSASLAACLKNQQFSQENNRIQNYCIGHNILDIMQNCRKIWQSLNLKKIRIETYLKMTYMFKLANKDFIVAVIHMLKDIKENSFIRNE